MALYGHFEIKSLRLPQFSVLVVVVIEDAVVSSIDKMQQVALHPDLKGSFRHDSLSLSLMHFEIVSSKSSHVFVMSVFVTIAEVASGFSEVVVG